MKMPIFNIKTNEKNKKYILYYREETLIQCDEEEKEAIETLCFNLNMIFQKQEIEIHAGYKMIEFYQKILIDTLADKLSDIDNMYVMKKMLTETSGELERLITRLEELRKQEETETSETQEPEKPPEQKNTAK